MQVVRVERLCGVLERFRVTFLFFSSRQPQYQAQQYQLVAANPSTYLPDVMQCYYVHVYSYSIFIRIDLFSAEFFHNPV